MSVAKRTILVYYEKIILVSPTLATHTVKIIIRRVRINVIVFKVGTILLEQDQQVSVVAYKMLRYLRVRLIQVEAIDY